MTPSTKNIIKKILLLLVILLLIGGFVFANYWLKNRACKNVEIEIVNGNSFGFIKSADVQNLLITKNGIVINQTKTSTINTKKLEQDAYTNPWVKHAKIYFTNNGTLHIQILQKEPKVRIVENDNSSYYLDSSASSFQLHSTFSANIPVASCPKFGSTLKDINTKYKIIALANHIAKDTFWNAMIEQIVVKDSSQFELVPAIGNNTITFGDTSKMQDKFNRLLLFYKTAIPKVGWDKYKQINVKYARQIIANINSDSTSFATSHTEITNTKTLSTPAPSTVKPSNNPTNPSLHVAKKILPAALLAIPIAKHLLKPKNKPNSKHVATKDKHNLSIKKTNNDKKIIIAKKPASKKAVSKKNVTDVKKPIVKKSIVKKATIKKQ